MNFVYVIAIRDTLYFWTFFFSKWDKMAAAKYTVNFLNW